MVWKISKGEGSLYRLEGVLLATDMALVGRVLPGSFVLGRWCGAMQACGRVMRVARARAMVVGSGQCRAASVQSVCGQWRASSPSRAATGRRQLDDGVRGLARGQGSVRVSGACRARSGSTGTGRRP